jgi:hypothetical protein
MKTMALAALSAATLLSTVAGGHAEVMHRHQVSRAQYRILINQCKYANGARARRSCRTNVRKHYIIGRRDPNLDCRTYASVTVCGKLKLSRSERACVKDSVRHGLTYRRAEVECYIYF